MYVYLYVQTFRELLLWRPPPRFAAVTHAEGTIDRGASEKGALSSERCRVTTALWHWSIYSTWNPSLSMMTGPSLSSSAISIACRACPGGDEQSPILMALKRSQYLLPARLPDNPQLTRISGSARYARSRDCCCIGSVVSRRHHSSARCRLCRRSMLISLELRKETHIIGASNHTLRHFPPNLINAREGRSHCHAQRVDFLVERGLIA